MNQIPRPGEKYRHFKNKLYQIVAIARHSETGEEMVVYQALYGDFGVWVRPLSMFMEKVDRVKYPEAAQEYRFERIPEGMSSEEEVTSKEEVASEEGLEIVDLEEEETPMHPLLLEFLDAESAEEQLAILQKMKGKVGQREVDSICFCLDVKPMTGELDLQLESIKKYIRMRQHYDAPRLRRGEWE
ncbi:MAG: DUF1653 domain-containing protein [Clostridium sp.]|nr:DUF1653 domain-containing protein [Clostridium sp.]